LTRSNALIEGAGCGLTRRPSEPRTAANNLKRYALWMAIESRALLVNSAESRQRGW
jgi:hypothetical protein